MELQGSELNRRHAQVMFVLSSSARIDKGSLSKPAEPRIRKVVARAISWPARRIHFAVWLHRNGAALGLAAALSQVANEFLARVELGARGLVAIEITDQTDAERDVVQVIAVHVATVDLAAPAIADFDLAVAG